MSTLTYSSAALEPCPPQPAPFGVGRQFRDHDVPAHPAAVVVPLRQFEPGGPLPRRLIKSENNFSTYHFFFHFITRLFLLEHFRLFKLSLFFHFSSFSTILFFLLTTLFFFLEATLFLLFATFTLLFDFANAFLFSLKDEF